MQTSYVEGKCKKILLYGRIHMISASSDTWERSCLFNIALTNQPATIIFSYFHTFIFFFEDLVVFVADAVF